VRIKLFEHGKQHQADDQPNCNFRKPLIIQAKLPLGRNKTTLATWVPF
jgi:hypothetical protein